MDEATPGDREPSPSPPALSERARPMVVDSGPLPGTPNNPGKPVVAADHRGGVRVVALDLEARTAHLLEWASSDGGRSWRGPRALDDRPDGSEFACDPWIQTDRRGRFFLVHNAVHDMPLTFRRLVEPSPSWSIPLIVTDGADRPVLGISPDGRRLAIAAAMTERTADYPTRPLEADDPQLRAKLKAAFRYRLGIYQSEDRGRTWTRLGGPLGTIHAIPFSVVIDDEGRIACSCVVEGEGSRSVVCATADRGMTWTETDFVTKLQPDRDQPFHGERFPVLALDGRGALHAVYVSALGKGIFARRSEDWRRWDDPVKLSSDAIDQARMPAVASWGPMVHATWLEQRDGRWRAYYIGSKDHGRNWSDRLLLTIPNADSPLIDDGGFEAISDDDQSAVADDGTGTAHAVWSVISRDPTKAPGRIWRAKIAWSEAGPPAHALPKEGGG